MTNSVYHPILNSNGTYKASDGKFWYETTVTLNSVDDCFTPANIGTVNGRPDGKSDKYVYAENMIDVREYAKVLTPYEVDLIKDDKLENGVEEVIGFEYLYNLGIFADLGSNQYRIYSGTYKDSFELYKSIIIKKSNGEFVPTKVVGSYDANNTIISPITGTLEIETVSVYGTVNKPILTSNTKLSIDLIGDPSNYPQVLKDRLASGVGVVGINPLLVDDNGNNLIPDGTFSLNDTKLSDKMTISLNGQVSDDSGATWSNISHTGDYITNTQLPDYTLSVGQIRILNYTSKNEGLIQSNPYPVIEVEPKVTASNSHSLYKGALIGNQVSGKIQVGNGANGYESKVLENIYPSSESFDYVPKNGVAMPTVEVGEKVLIDDTFTLASSGSGIYKAKIQVVGWVPNIAINTIPASDWEFVGEYIGKATHSTIALDNANSPASKWFETLEEGNNGVLAGVYGEELVYNGATTSFDGDDNTFEQLTNTSIIDLNGNTAKCFHGSVALNGKVK